MRARLAATARARGISESELLRAAINREIDGAPNAPDPAVPDPQRAELDRITVRLPAFVLEAAAARAQARGMALSRWIAALVRSNLVREPVLTDAEIGAVKFSARELAAIGRNINQIARALNESHPQFAGVRIADLREFAAAVEASRATIRSLVRASRNVWGSA